MTVLFISIAILLLWGIVELSCWMALKYFWRDKIEFPEVSQELLDKFSSWDPMLGWCNKPNLRKQDRSDRKNTDSDKTKVFPCYTTDSNGSRTPFEPENPTISITCYGDSYCMCREREDDQTWPWYLGQTLGARVSNYGVGNYGLDQALLRIERDFDRDPADVVILAVTAVTVARMVSVYRHYLEPGNILAIKPRFIFNKDKSLKLVHYPVESKNQLRDLSAFQEHFRKYDAHYKKWITGKPGFPYSLSVLNKSNRQHINILFLRILFRFNKKLHKFLSTRLKEKENIRNIEYELSFWGSDSDLFISVLERFAVLAKSRGFIPVFLLQHQKRFLDNVDHVSNDLAWKPILKRAGEQIDGLHVLDTFPWLYDVANRSSLYGSSHHSELGNRVVAHEIGKYIQQKIAPGLANKNESLKSIEIEPEKLH